MKKIIKTGLLIFLIFVACTASIYADTSIMVPMTNNQSEVSANLFVENGKANIYCRVTTNQMKITKVSANLTLQQYKRGKWLNYAEWSASENSSSCIVSKSISVPKGYRYRTKAYCTACSSTTCEYVTRYSVEVSY